MITVGECILMTQKGATLYERFIKARSINRKWEEEEDIKISDMFLKLEKTQAENTIVNDKKSGLEQAFDEMVMVKNAYDEVMNDN
jgi:hypothetical protein